MRRLSHQIIVVSTAALLESTGFATSVSQLIKDKEVTVGALVERTENLVARASLTFVPNSVTPDLGQVARALPVGRVLDDGDKTFAALIKTVPRRQPSVLVDAPSVTPRRDAVVDMGTFVRPPTPNTALDTVITLKATLSGGAIRVVPDHIDLSKPGQSVRVSIATGSATEVLNLFVRDAAIISYNPQEREVTALKPGRTELYLVGGGKMLIVPIGVAAAKSGDSLTIPETLMSLNDLMNQGSGFPQAQIEGDVPAAAAEANHTAAPDASLRVSEDKEDKGEEEQGAYGLIDHKQSYKSLLFKVMDTRSSSDQALIYPAASVDLQVIGTEFKAKSDNAGHVPISDVPAGSRFFVSLTDPRGLMRPSVVEVYATTAEGRQSVPLRIMSYQVFEAITSVLGVAQQADLASICGTVLDASNQFAPLASHQVSINVEAQGPYYFNDVGPDRTLGMTANNGRFCFFNAKGGLAQLGVFTDGTLVGATAVPLVGGAHLDDSINVGNAPSLKTHLGVMPAAHDQLYGEDTRLQLKSLDSVDLIPLGHADPMEYVGQGIMGLPRGTTMYRGRLYSMVQAAEFEPVLYSYSAEDFRKPLVTPLIPRGFVDEIYNELSAVDGQDAIAYDPSMGSVVVFHGQTDATRGKPVHIRLLDVGGHEMQGGWFFGAEQSGLVRAIFFNLEPGIYSVIVENDSHYWLAAETTAVDYWTVSLVQSGARMTRR